MDKNVTQHSDDNSTGMKIARWTVWGVVALLMLWFVIQLPVFHIATQ